MQRIGEEEIEAVARVIRGGHLSRYSWKRSKKGECEQFEEELATKYEKKHALLLSSGTNALISALVGSGIEPGDEVIVPAYTYIATPGAVLACGAVPIIANIDSTFSLDPEDVKKLIGPKTKAIIPVHMNGRPAQMDKLEVLAKENNLVLIEDVSQAMGGSFQGRKLGTFGRVGCFSFNNFKILTCGEGGGLVTDDQKIYERAFINHDMGVNFREYLDAFQEPIFIGQSMRVSEISGAIMRVQLNRLDSIVSELKARQERYLSVLNKGKTFKINRSHCAEGECGSAILLDFESPELCLRAEERLSHLWMFASQVSKFYRHIVASWEPILSKRVGHHAYFNPMVRQDASINLERLRPSLERFDKSLLLFVPLEKTLEEIEMLAHHVLGAIEKGI